MARRRWWLPRRRRRLSGWRPGGGQPRTATGVDGKKIMEQIATRTGGHFFEAKKKDALEDIYNQIADELRGQYLLSYTPDQVDTEGDFHKIVLKAKKDDLTVARAKATTVRLELAQSKVNGSRF